MNPSSRLLRSYLDFVHGSHRGLQARDAFTNYLEALRAASGRERIMYASDFHHPTWKRNLQYIVNFGEGRNDGAPVEVLSGYIRAKTQGPVNSFYRDPSFSPTAGSETVSYWNRADIVENVRAGIARADYSWWHASGGKPGHALRVAALALEAIRTGHATKPPTRFPDWLQVKERPLQATRKAAAVVLEDLKRNAPIPYTIPTEIFQQPSRNKAALLAQYLEAQGLQPAQVGAALRLHDLPRHSGNRPVSRLLFDWRQRHHSHFERRPSRYDTPEPPSHLIHTGYTRYGLEDY